MKIFRFGLNKFWPHNIFICQDKLDHNNVKNELINAVLNKLLDIFKVAGKPG